MNALKISMVSYLNSKPFILGMELANLLDNIELHLEIPSRTAKKLIENKVDVALVPVAVLPQLQGVDIITDYCIGADGFVDSVFLFSQVPIHKLSKIHLDAHSRTSANLLKVLLNKHWKHNVQYIENTEIHHSLIKDDIGCLIIGDKSIPLRNQFTYQYDLAHEWKQYTKLPFVFAVWVAKQGTNKSKIKELNKALSLGINHIEKVIPLYNNLYPKFDLTHYLTQNISYSLDAKKKKAIDLFLNELEQINNQTLI